MFSLFEEGRKKGISHISVISPLLPLMRVDRLHNAAGFPELCKNATIESEVHSMPTHAEVNHILPGMG